MSARSKASETEVAQHTLNTAIYGTAGMEEEEGVVSMEEALRRNKELAAERPALLKKVEWMNRFEKRTKLKPKTI